jgi:hypothetical protein
MSDRSDAEAFRAAMDDFDAFCRSWAGLIRPSKAQSVQSLTDWSAEWDCLVHDLDGNNTALWKSWEFICWNPARWAEFIAESFALRQAGVIRLINRDGGDSQLVDAWIATQRDWLLRTGAWNFTSPEAVRRFVIAGYVHPSEYFNLDFFTGEQEVRGILDHAIFWTLPIKREQKEPALLKHDEERNVNDAVSTTTLEPRSEYRFELDVSANVWCLQFKEEQWKFHNDAFGFKYIALLLEKNNVLIPVERLVGLDLGPYQADAEVLDKQAIDQIRCEIAEIDIALREVAGFRDSTERDKLEKEKQQLMEQLSSAVDNRGKSRLLDNGNEVRKHHDSVRNAIKRARKKIKETMPQFADHLKYINGSGNGFVYRPTNPAPSWDIAYYV